MSAFRAQPLGWTDEALAGVERLRGWNEGAIERLLLEWDDPSGRVVFPVIDQGGDQLGALHYMPDPARRNGRPKMEQSAGVPRQLFPPPELIRDDELDGGRLLLAEGESDGVAAWSHGFACVGVPGTGGWKDEYAARFSGRRWTVYVCFDCDSPGRSARGRVAASLAAAGVEVQIVELDPARDDGYDLTDYLRDHDADALRALLDRAPAYVPPVTTNPQPSRGKDDPPQLRTVRGDAIEMRSIEWRDKPLLQGSAFHLAAGPKGVGKGTWLALKIAANTQGKFGPKRNVLIVSSEDSATIDLKPRLYAAGADHTRWHLITDDLVLPRDLFRLEDLANEFGDVGLIVLDPVGNHLGGVDTDKEGLVRFAIGGLNRLADDLACIIIGVRHLSKSRIHGALAAVLGSTAWVDVPRAVLAFARDDEEDQVFHVQVIAGNRSGRTAAHGYRIELRDVGLAEPVTCAVSIGETRKSVDDLLAAPRRESKSADARELILDVLETDGDQESDALDARVADETGLSAKTIRNLRGELKAAGLIKAMPESDEPFGAVSRWKVVRTSAPRPGTREVPE